MISIYHRPTGEFWEVPEEEAKILTDYYEFIDLFKRQGCTGPMNGIVQLRYICSIGEVEGRDIRKGDYIRLPNTPAAKVLFSHNKAKL